MSAHALVDTVRQIARHEVSQHPGVDIGVVTSVQSPDGLHSIDVQLRTIGLPLSSVPIAVGALGFASLPAVGDLVVVAFAGGDIHYPVIMGRLYDDQTKPPKNDPGDVVLVRPQGNDSGASIVLKTGDDGKHSLTITIDGSETIEAKLDDDVISLAAGDATLKLDSGGTGTFKVGDASIELKKDGTVSIKGQKLSIKGSQIEIDGDSTVKVSGQTIDLN